MSFKLFPPHIADFYKTGHLRMYPKGTQYVYSNFTPRSSRLASMFPESFDNKVVFVGLQATIIDLLINQWDENFFDVSLDEVVDRYKAMMDSALGVGSVNVEHIKELHQLGYLPLRIKALPEGSRVNIGVPVFTVVNTNPKFYWLTNYIETQLSAESWKLITTATIAYEYRKLLNHYADKTGSPKDFVEFQGHDFSARGMSGNMDATKSGMGHLLSFLGTDTISSIDFVKHFYYVPPDEFVGGSVPATEHSVMCMGSKESEIDTFRRLINELYPTGVISIVSDTWDFWKVISEYAKTLKDDILSRKINEIGLAKVVFRPDSGDPVKVICGDPEAKEGTPAHKGAIQCLWEIFGGSITETGHKILDPHVGVIYGDSITYDRAERILRRLDEMGFASGNMVFGIGSFTYQHNTRDTFGHAYKSTWGVINGKETEIFKDPITDSGTKKSAKGLLRVIKKGNDFVLEDGVSRGVEQTGELQTVFMNGQIVKYRSWKEIRDRLHSS